MPGEKPALKIDVRFNKIAVSLFDTHPLEWYFTHSERMERATLYCNVHNEWSKIGTRDIFEAAPRARRRR